MVSVQAISLAIFAPLWGSLSDRLGRKRMLQRAMFGCVITLGAMGLVSNVRQLLLLRILQGVVTGTVAAAYTLVAAGTPLTLAAIAAGVLFGFRGVRPSRCDGGAGSLPQAGRQLARFAWNLLPFFLVIALTVGLDIHLVYPLAVVTTGVVLSTRMPPGRLRRLARRHLSIDLAFLIWGIMLFKEILAATGAMADMAGDLSAMGIPPLALVVLLPALIAFITGYTTAFVGLSFPVLVPLIEPGGMSAYYVMLGLASGIGAHMLSPMHACLAMTLQYYEAGMGKTYRLLFMPAAVVFLTAVCVFAAAGWLAG